ncbi:MAG: hypothetical protein ABFD63_09545, partial [Smithella sp.]
QNPIGVAEYQLQSKLPAEMKGKLPTARQLADVVRAGLHKARLGKPGKILSKFSHKEYGDDAG